MLFAYGCGDKPPKPPVATAPKPAAAVQPAPPQAEVAEAEPEQQGYIYDRRNRRDPFLALIQPRKVKPVDTTKPGTLESYGLKEFTLKAIAKMGTQYYALLVTPDNRSFTVFKGNAIGLNDGIVKKITDKKIVLLEYTEEYTGEKVPSEIILEFYKGEGE